MAVEVGTVWWFSVKGAPFKRVFCEFVLDKQSAFEKLFSGGFKGLRLKAGWFSLVTQFETGILLVDVLSGLKPGGGGSKLKGPSNFGNKLICGSTNGRSEMVKSSVMGKLVKLSDFGLLVVKGLTCGRSLLVWSIEIGAFAIISPFGILELIGLTCVRSELFKP